MSAGRVFNSFLLLSLPVMAADKWIDYRMGPFHVLSDAGDKAAREKLNQMEQMRYSLGTQLGKVGMGKDGLVTMWPIDLVLFGNQRDYLAHSPGKPFIDGGSATLSAWSGDAPLPRDWLRALARMLIDDNAGRMPDAIETALCDLYSTIKVANTKISLGAPLPDGELQGARLRAWAKMQMLATLPDYSGKLRVYLNNMQQNGDEGVAVRNAFDMTAAQLDLKLDAYVKAGKFEAATSGGEPLNPEHDFVEKPMEKASVDGLFAELAAGGKNFPSGSPRGLVAQNTLTSLELAIKANPRWAEPHFKLAALRERSDDKMKELKAAATLDPRNAPYWRRWRKRRRRRIYYDDAAKILVGGRASGGGRTGEGSDPYREAGARCGAGGFHRGGEEASGGRSGSGSGEGKGGRRGGSSCGGGSHQCAAERRQGRLSEAPSEWWDAPTGLKKWKASSRGWIV